jgi:hypothetical protein
MTAQHPEDQEAAARRDAAEQRAGQEFDEREALIREAAQAGMSEFEFRNLKQPARVDPILPLSMRIFAVTFQGYWLDGTAVIVAPDPATALTLLQEHLVSMALYDRGLAKKNTHLTARDCREIPLGQSAVHVLDDGDY